MANTTLVYPSGQDKLPYTNNVHQSPVEVFDKFARSQSTYNQQYSFAPNPYMSHCNAASARLLYLRYGLDGVGVTGDTGPQSNNMHSNRFPSVLVSRPTPNPPGTPGRYFPFVACLNLLRLTDLAKAELQLLMASANLLKDDTPCRPKVNGSSRLCELPLGQSGCVEEPVENQAAGLTIDQTNIELDPWMGEDRHEQRPIGATNIDDRNAHLRMPRANSLNDNIVLGADTSKTFSDYAPDVSRSTLRRHHETSQTMLIFLQRRNHGGTNFCLALLLAVHQLLNPSTLLWAPYHYMAD